MLPPPPGQTEFAFAAPRPTRRRSKKVLLVLMAFLFLGAGIVAGTLSRDTHWRPLYRSAMADAAHWEAQSQSWEQKSRTFQTSGEQTQEQLDDLETKIKSTVGSLDSPHFLLWNSCGSAPTTGCPLTPGSHYVGGIPDTFTYHVAFRSTVPVTVRIMSIHDYVCWDTGLCPSHWVWWQNVTHLRDGVFQLSEGCGSYVSVITSEQSGTLYPHISATRDPASAPTGACR